MRLFVLHCIACIAGALLLASTPARAGNFSEMETRPFGTFGDIAYVIHTGRFTGTTSLGNYSVPFEVVAPADPAQGNGAVLFEPPHFSLRTGARDLILGRGLLYDRGSHFLFERGFAHASVGFGDFGLNILDPGFEGLELAGAPIPNPGVPDPIGQTIDEEILVQFVEALDQSPEGRDMVGMIEFRYSFGVSQTSAVLLNLLLGPNGQGLFDYSMLALRFWPEPTELGASIFPRLSGEFSPPTDAGKIMFLQSESELVRTDAEQLRVEDPAVRTYEVAGAPHTPAPPNLVRQNPPTFLNALDISPVGRALFAAGDDWVRNGTVPPADTILDAAPAGQEDPVYGRETGIARDGNLNALGGIRFPDLVLGRTHYIATVPDLDPPQERFPGMLGLQIDLTCAPLPDGAPRFRNHGDYVSRYVREINRLVAEGFLLEADAEFLKTRAAESDVGKPRTCN